MLCNRWIDASTPSSIRISPFPLFLDSYTQLTSSLGCRSYAVFLFYGLFAIVQWRIAPSLNQASQLRCFYLWCDCCYTVWYRVVFSFFWRTLPFNFFHLHLFHGVCFHYSQVFVGFLFSEHSDFFLVGLFLSSYVISRFSLSLCHIFLSQITSLYPDSKFSLPELGLRSFIFGKQFDVVHVHLWLFQISCNCWSFIRVWVISSLFRIPGPFSVLCPMTTIL